jgi:hypothetical protein
MMGRIVDRQQRRHVDRVASAFEAEGLANV